MREDVVCDVAFWHSIITAFQSTRSNITRCHPLQAMSWNRRVDVPLSPDTFDIWPLNVLQDVSYRAKPEVSQDKDTYPSIHQETRKKAGLEL